MKARGVTKRVKKIDTNSKDELLKQSKHESSFFIIPRSQNLQTQEKSMENGLGFIKGYLEEMEDKGGENPSHHIL